MIRNPVRTPAAVRLTARSCRKPFGDPADRSEPPSRADWRGVLVAIPLEPFSRDGTGNCAFAVLLFAGEARSYHRQQCNDSRLRRTGLRARAEFPSRAPENPTVLDVERFVVVTEHKLLIAVRRCDAAENAARLFVIGARRKPEPSGIADRVLGQLAAPPPASFAPSSHPGRDDLEGLPGNRRYC